MSHDVLDFLMSCVVLSEQAWTYRRTYVWLICITINIEYKLLGLYGMAVHSDNRIFRNYTAELYPVIPNTKSTKLYINHFQVKIAKKDVDEESSHGQFLVIFCAYFFNILNIAWDIYQVSVRAKAFLAFLTFNIFNQPTQDYGIKTLCVE